eukprot:jgi/Mesen1/3973/ME000210S03212
MAPRKALVIPLSFLCLILLSEAVAVQAAADPLRGLTSIIFFKRWWTVTGLAQTMLERVAKDRRARGDIEGADRIQGVAKNWLSPFGWWKQAFRVTWDYISYFWTSKKVPGSEHHLRVIMKDLAKLTSLVGELILVRDDAGRRDWMLRNWSQVVTLGQHVSDGLRHMFYKPGPIQDMVKVLQKELSDGKLPRDVANVAGQDLHHFLKEIPGFLQPFIGGKKDIKQDVNGEGKSEL